MAPDRGGEQDRVELALVRDVAVDELVGAEHDGDQRGDEEHAEERGVVVDGDELGEALGVLAEVEEADGAGAERAEDRQPGQQVARDLEVAAEGVQQQHGGGGAREHELGDQQRVLEVEVFAHESTSGMPSSRPIVMRSIQGAGPEAEREDRDSEHEGAGALGPGDLADVGPPRAGLAEEGAREHAQQEGRGDRGREHGQSADDWIGAERTDEDVDLGDEPGEAGQAERGEASNHEEDRPDRHLTREPGEVGELAVVGLVVERADEQEEERSHDAVGEHLEDGAAHADEVERAKADEDVAHVRDGGEAGHQLEVGLAERADGAVERADDAEREQRGRPELGALGEDLEA